MTIRRIINTILNLPSDLRRVYQQRNYKPIDDIVYILNRNKKIKYVEKKIKALAEVKGALYKIGHINKGSGVLTDIELDVKWGYSSDHMHIYTFYQKGEKWKLKNWE